MVTRRIKEDNEDRMLAEELRDLISKIVEHKFRTRRVRGSALIGGVPKSQGGTGTSNGTATPKPFSVTDAEVAVGADIDPNKLNQSLLEDLVYFLVKNILVEGPGLVITPDDGGNLLELSTTLTDHGLGDHSDVQLYLPVMEGDALLFLSGKWRNIAGSYEPGALYLDGELLTLDGETLTLET